MAKILSYPEPKGEKPSRRAVQARVITRRLRKVTLKLWDVVAEIAFLQSLIPPPSSEELKEILEGRRGITEAHHLLGILYGMRLLLDEVFSVAEEPASFPREGNTYFKAHSWVLQGLRTLRTRQYRPQGLRTSIREEAPPRPPSS